MVVFGLLSMLLPAGVGGWLAWENRDTIVRVHVGEVVWTGHLYAVLVVGALFACWFVLGAAFIQCRLAERRRARAGEPVTPAERPPRRRSRPAREAHSAQGRAAATGAVRRVPSPG